METRRLGRTGHWSTVAIFGGVALLKLAQKDADRVLQQVMEAGINHIDVAPEYGLAEERLGPWMPRCRDQFFLGCKTMERTRSAASAEMYTSLKKLRIKAFDLYQLHCVSTFHDLDQVAAPGGALETLQEARQVGLTRFVGITAHGLHAPEILLEALNRYDFDTILFPVNFILYANPAYRQKAEELIRICQARDIGIMAIKAICKGPYPGPKTYNTMYLPFADPEQIQKGVDFTLSQPVTGTCTVGDPGLLPIVLQACEHYQNLSSSQQEDLISTGSTYTPLWT